NPGAARIVLVVDDHGRVLVERDQRPVVPAVRLLGPDDDSLHDLALLDRALRGRRLHGTDDHVADSRVAAMVAADDADAENLSRAGVVGHAQPAFLLNHGRSPPAKVVSDGRAGWWLARTQGALVLVEHGRD